MERGFRWVVAAALALLSVGSAGQARASVFTFTVEFDGKGCPIAAPADAPNCEAPVQRRDCVKVEQKKGHKVKIVAKPREIPFELTVTPAGLGFDPEGAAGKLKSRYRVRIDEAKSGTTYKFSVSVGTCPPLDPTIIIR